MKRKNTPQDLNKERKREMPITLGTNRKIARNNKGEDKMKVEGSLVR